MNSLAYLLVKNPRQCTPRSSDDGLNPGQQINYTNPVPIVYPVPFGTKCQNAPPMYGPIIRNKTDVIFDSRQPNKSYYELGSYAGNWPLKLTAKQKKMMNGKPSTGV